MLTHHTYPHLLGRQCRLAATIWEDLDTVEEAVAATIREDNQAIVLLARVIRGRDLRGYAPGGMGTV